MYVRRGDFYASAQPVVLLLKLYLMRNTLQIFRAGILLKFGVEIDAHVYDF
jgi:hypothetical protein